MSGLLLVVLDTKPDDNDVVAGWVAFVVFVALAVAVVVLGFSLTKRLKNVDRAAEEGRYDPSDPKPGRRRPARGLAAHREAQARAAAEDAGVDAADSTGDDEAGEDRRD